MWIAAEHFDMRTYNIHVILFIEDNWLKGARIGGGSTDAIAGSILNMFDFNRAPRLTPFYVDPKTGTKLSSAPAA